MEKTAKILFFLLLPPLLTFPLFSSGTGPASVSPSPAAPESAPAAYAPACVPITVYVDGKAIAGFAREGDPLHYAPAGSFLDALDASFWAGEKEALRFAPLELEGQSCLCVEDCCAAWGIALYQASDGSRVWCTSAAGSWAPPAGFSVPVLMYHGVGDNLRPGAELVVRTADLDRQLALLLERGYTPIWFEDLKHVDQIRKPVLLTFDDGYRDNYTELFPLLQKHGVKATLFVVSGFMGNPHTLTEGQIREMQASGLVSIQCHTRYHQDLDTLSYDEQVEELCWSKVALLELTDREPYVIAYPRGRQNDDTLAICREDYRFGLKMGGAPYVTGDDPLLIHRISIPRSMRPEEFSALFP